MITNRGKYDRPNLTPHFAEGFQHHGSRFAHGQYAKKSLNSRLSRVLLNFGREKARLRECVPQIPCNIGNEAMHRYFLQWVTAIAAIQTRAASLPSFVRPRREVIVAKPKAEDEREKRIEDLKRHAEELCGGQIEGGTLDDCSAEAEEAFWKQLVDYEEAPWTTHFQQLENAGVSLPPPDSLKDEELTAKLWEVIQKLALLHVFIQETDHLSDRELYTHLWTDSLWEEAKALPLAANSAYHIQMLGSGSEEDNLLYLKYGMAVAPVVVLRRTRPHADRTFSLPEYP